MNIFAENLSTQCREEYQAKIKELGTQEAMDAWTGTLEEDLAEVHDLDAQGSAAKRVIDIENELVQMVFHHGLPSYLGVYSQSSLEQSRCATSCSCPFLRLLCQSIQPPGTSDVWSWSRVKRDVLSPRGQPSAPSPSSYAERFKDEAWVRDTLS